LASLLRNDGAGMSCGRGLGVRRRPTRRTSSHPRMHGRAGARRRAGRLPPGRWTPGDLCCGASCWKPRRPRVSTHRSTFPATCQRAAVIGGSMGARAAADDSKLTALSSTCHRAVTRNRHLTFIRCQQASLQVNADEAATLRRPPYAWWMRAVVHLGVLCRRASSYS
jgi:hypothetical protein